MADRWEPGHLVDRVTLQVEAGKIRELVRATGTTDAVHISAEDAAGRGAAAQIAPLTYSVTTGHLRDQRAFVAGLGLSIERVVVGAVSWVYHRPLVAGDVLEAVRRVESDERREGRSGPLRLVGLITEFVDVAGEVVLVQRETLVERAVS